MISFQISSWVPAEFWSLQTLLAVICVYLYGSIPFAYLFTYLFKKQRLTDKGTGNIGVANAFGVGGLKAGFLTVLCEASKVVVPIAIARYYYDAALAVTLIFVVISILGTSYSIFLKGKGGQGGTILLWALLLLSPYTLLAFLVGFIIIYFVIRNRYYTSLIGHVLLPVELFLIEGNLPFVIFGVFAAIFYSLRYKPQKSDYSHYKKDMKLLRFLEEKFIKKNKYIIPINKAKDPSRVGMKAQKLHYLKKAGFRIPQTYVCKFAAYDEYRSGDENVLNRLGAELEGLPLNGRTFGIRSSANVEDGEDLSFAGQFESYLDVGSVSQVLNAMVKVWDSAKGERVMAYLSRASLSQSDFKMAAIIQEMVKARCSGVAFTKNPVSGFDEVIVEAVNGLGDRLLQGQVKPLRWVNKWGKWLEQPQDGEIDRELIARVVSEAREIAKKYGTPVDLEWAYDGEELYWLQLRAITALKGINIYSNKISKEFMPGIIKPLIWSVNIPVVNSSWKRLFVELLGKDARSIDIYNLAKSFYYRAYFNMGVLGDIFELLGMPRELLEMLLGIDVSAGKGPRFRPGIKTVKYLPNMLLFGLRKALFSRQIEHFLAAQRRKYEDSFRVGIDTLDGKETIARIEQLFAANTDSSYYVIVTELLMGFYNMALGKVLKRQGIDINDVDFASSREALRDIDPNYHIARLHDQYEGLPEAVKNKLRNGGLQEPSRSGELEYFVRYLHDFLARFGHLSDSDNDFSGIQWRESPDMLLEMVIDYQHPAIQPSAKVEIGSLTKGLRGLPVKILYNKTAKYRTYRERVNALYVYGYANFRPYFMHLARLFTKNGYMSEENDIFYLNYDEIKQIVASGVMPETCRANLIQRKNEILLWKDIELPGLIVGDTLPSPLHREQVSESLRGIATSKGYCEGRVKVVRGIKDFSKVEDGDILVIPHSDVSWTPLFVKAKGIVSESGGMLSHCSIVAREYNIPAVVSVSGALKLKNGAMVKVDGYEGEIMVLKRQP